MYKEVFEPKTEYLLEKIKETSVFQEFYLAGDTALALQYGHRKSIDLYFFPKKSFLLRK